MTDTAKAAELIRELHGGRKLVWAHDDAPHTKQYVESLQVLADAYLAEHDPTPIDEAGLRSVGFEGPHFDDPERLQLTLGRLKFTHYCGQWNLWLAFGPGPVGYYERLRDDVKTLGEVRLAAAFCGIPLPLLPAQENPA